MSFHSPFDKEQWKAAKRSYSDLRTSVKFLETNYPPHTGGEQDILHLYKAFVRGFGKELVKPLPTIKADRLNEMNDKAITAFLVYRGTWKAWK